MFISEKLKQFRIENNINDDVIVKNFKNFVNPLSIERNEENVIETIQRGLLIYKNNPWKDDFLYLYEEYHLNIVLDIFSRYGIDLKTFVDSNFESLKPLNPCSKRKIEIFCEKINNLYEKDLSKLIVINNVNSFEEYSKTIPTLIELEISSRLNKNEKENKISLSYMIQTSDPLYIEELTFKIITNNSLGLYFKYEDRSFDEEFNLLNKWLKETKNLNKLLRYFVTKSFVLFPSLFQEM